MKLLFYEEPPMIAEVSKMTKREAINRLSAIVGDMYDPESRAVHVSGFGQPISGTVKLDYPLTTPYEFKIYGATLVGEIVWLIAQAYVAIYEEELATATVAEGFAAPDSLNRNKTDGKYGIWGHGIEDLVVEEIAINDPYTISVFIGS